jgi:hypothetical protein
MSIYQDFWTALITAQHPENTAQSILDNLRSDLLQLSADVSAHLMLEPGRTGQLSQCSK